MMTTDHLSFAEQALHYFDRPHDALPRPPLGGPAAWRGADLASRDDWIVTLTAAEVAELDALRETLRGRGRTVATLRRADVVLPTLGARVAAWRRELTAGRGFLVVRGLPVERWGDDDAALVYWALGPRDRSTGGAEPGRRSARARARHRRGRGRPLRASLSHGRRHRLPLRPADAVGLLCLRAARAGASRLVSSVTVYNELARRRPDLVARLFEPVYLDRRNEQKDGGPGWVPVIPCRFASGKLRTFYHSDYFRSVTRHADVPPFTAAEQELLDLYEAIAAEPALRLDMQFAPGDIQLVSNHVILHARTAYEAAPDPMRQRHLLRLWLSLDADA
jgi:hypothetical protein